MFKTPARSTGKKFVLQTLLAVLLLNSFPIPAAEKPLEQSVRGLSPMLESNIDRPLRYYPVNGDFVITNGAGFFNRPLYGGNTAFRVDAGDQPEFSLYLPGRGGNLRLGFKTSGAKWLAEAEQVVARYRPGAMIYEVRDPLLGTGVLHLEVLATRQTEGLLVQAELRNTSIPVELICAFGGVNGERGRRDGDIGCEAKPVSEFFQLRAEQCRSNAIVLGTNSFAIRGRPGVIGGVLPENSIVAIGDARHWGNVTELLASAGKNSEQPIALGRIPLRAGQPCCLGIQRLAANNNADEVLEIYREVAEQTNATARASAVKPWQSAELAGLFAHEEEQRRAIADRVVLDTPDPYLNAVAGALNIAADAVWDDRQNSFMHGGVAWRVRLLGWRGPYSGDELGWHERTRQHFEGYAKQQNTDVVPEKISVPEPSANLSRNETALHSNGDLTRSHYDMNLVGVDAFFRHLRWTGDLEFARRMWPTIERHLAWERRLFRREYGAGKLPLYEAYCCIWASDDLAYNGGGATHSSAYNFFHNQLAAQVAKLLGKDPSLYEQEAALIANGMRQELWLPDRGWFGEWKDLLGGQLVHPNAAAWTFYHPVDSEMPTPIEAWQMSRFVDTQIARIPVRGANVPPGNFTVPTTSWLPYTWSLNNVVMAEATHTALAYWQAGRVDAALPLLKGALLDSMFLGLCPGNVGMTTFYDSYRRESQRDFADGSGSLSRALVEGLFGVQPDLLSGELKLRPGFPASWDHASIRHPDFEFAFKRASFRENYIVRSKFSRPLRLRLQIPALRDEVASVTVNGHPAVWRVLEDSIGAPRLEIMATPASTQQIVIEWKGKPPAEVKVTPIAALRSEIEADCGARILNWRDPQGALSEARVEQNLIHAIAAGTLGQRTVFAQVEQGSLRWWQPIQFEIRPAWELIPAEKQDATHLRFRLRNNTVQPFDGKALVLAGGNRSEIQLTAATFSDSKEIALTAGLQPGSNPIVVELGNGLNVSNQVVNWQIQAKPGTRFETVELAAVFNDRVTQIFRNDYLSPRSPFCSLAVPRQGTGSWCHPTDSFNVDDSGLRATAGKNEGRIAVQGIPFSTPTGASPKNILYTSQWQNYPEQASVPLTGRASHAYLLMAGSSNPMQSRFDNGEVTVTYTDGTTARLALENPLNWWPIDQDYFIDDFGFRRPEAIPLRVDLKTGAVRVLDATEFKGKGRTVPGGAATVLDLPLDAGKELKSLTVHAVANEVVIGLMSVTLAR